MEPIVWERTTNVPPAAARAWYFDLQEDDHMGHDHKPLYGGKGAPRKILSRTADTVVVVDDYGGGPPTQVTVKLVGDHIDYHFESPMYEARSKMTFEPSGTGTRLKTVAHPGWKGFGKVVGFFMRKSFPELIKKDLDAHAVEMERDWAKQPW